MSGGPHDPHGGHGHGDNIPPGEEPRFLDKEENVRKVLWVFYALCAILFLGDFVYDRYTYHPWENLWGFYPLYGFAGIVVLVLLAKQLRKVVMRDEDYYDAR